MLSLVVSLAICVILLGLVALAPSTWQRRATVTAALGMSALAIFWYVQLKATVVAEEQAKDQPLPEATKKRVEVVEKALKDPGSELRELHKIAVETFVAKPNFGMRRLPTPEELNRYRPKEWSLGDLDSDAPKDKAGELERLHLLSMMMFAKPSAAATKFKVKDDKEHLVVNLKLPNNWYLHSLGLVGLLVHKDPMVYTTSERFSMQQLSKSAKRPVDTFETRALDDLRAGEDFFAREKEGELRMVGAIRATEQCMSCHDVPRGHLLGAFSYILTKGALGKGIKSQLPGGR